MSQLRRSDVLQRQNIKDQSAVRPEWSRYPLVRGPISEQSDTFLVVLFRQIGGSMQNNTGFAVPLLGTQKPQEDGAAPQERTASALSCGR